MGFDVFLLFLSKSFHQFWQSMEDGRTTKPELVVNGRIAANHGACGNVVRDARLGGGDGAVADFAVPGYADLACKDHILSNVG